MLFWVMAFAAIRFYKRSGIFGAWRGCPRHEEQRQGNEFPAIADHRGSEWKDELQMLQASRILSQGRSGRAFGRPVHSSETAPYAANPLRGQGKQLRIQIARR